VVLSPQDDTLPWGIPASALLHVVLVAMLAVMPAPKRPKRPQDEPVSVDILTPRQFDAIGEVKAAPHAAEPPPVPAPPAASPALAPQAPPATAAPPAMIHPTEMLSAKTLADPRSRQARADLATFASDERMVQLCNLEAMDQIRKWRADFLPERVVPYATAEEKIAGTTISADGAAFRSKRNWYALKFKCELAPDGESVTGFDFLIGDPVARDKWDELGLPAVH
jgi:type IV secretory pathway VirB10-like protein